MIYLIDDNQHNQRLNNYNITFVEDGEFDGHLTSIERLEIGKNIYDTSHLQFLTSAQCILLHATMEDFNKEKGFLSGSKTNALLIKETISQEGEKIPLVLFSNSMGEAVFDYERSPNFVNSINKNIFYGRLFDFLVHYKRTGDIELKILALGKNFRSIEISELASEILRVVELKNNSDSLMLSDLSGTLKNFKLFIELSLPQNNVSAILNEIEDNPLKVQEFRRKINKITESYVKYGKNIYTWE